MTSFFATEAADDFLFTYMPMDFKVSSGFPLLGLFLPITALAAALSRIFLGRFGRRRQARPAEARPTRPHSQRARMALKSVRAEGHSRLIATSPAIGL